jgi:CheY-like chemotaxis protein
MTSTPTLRPVLLIDDSHEDLFLTKRLLTRAAIKHPIVTVDDGEEAIVFLRASTLAGAADLLPCCIFCDVKMPKLDGFAILQWARAQKLLMKTPFVMLTGGDMPEDREKALALGADHFVIKFPPPEVLKRIVDRANHV